ncbi:hypothetical protein [Paraburkholderia sp. SIMBA_054]|uniref:hypothetical protein n=1 Tax=Paraburkholderia sp. SIMBA_054 TaxID=3085795 RepID=UPI00397B4830
MMNAGENVNRIWKKHRQAMKPTPGSFNSCRPVELTDGTRVEALYRGRRGPIWRLNKEPRRFEQVLEYAHGLDDRLAGTGREANDQSSTSSVPPPAVKADEPATLRWRMSVARILGGALLVCAVAAVVLYGRTVTTTPSPLERESMRAQLARDHARCVAVGQQYMREHAADRLALEDAASAQSACDVAARTQYPKWFRDHVDSGW